MIAAWKDALMLDELGFVPRLSRFLAVALSKTSVFRSAKGGGEQYQVHRTVKRVEHDD